jgi:hypothetical protein
MSEKTLTEINDLLACFCEAENLTILHDFAKNALHLTFNEPHAGEFCALSFEGLKFFFVKSDATPPENFSLIITDFGVYQSENFSIAVQSPNPSTNPIRFFLATHFQTFYFDAEKIILNGEDLGIRH